ncbi:MAG: hypothetical protein IKZ87_06520 [Actinomycetaceae bacterium]|nr:hypothetical protein [Actinomycetaceae bacterium]
MKTNIADAQQSLFASNLNDALARFHLSPEELVYKLRGIGYFLSAETLNRWCEGKSLPRDSSAFQIAACLEDILGVERGQLCESLLRDLFPVKPFISDEHVAPKSLTLPLISDFDADDDSFSLTEDTDWAVDSHRLVVKDEMRISPDRKTALWSTTIGSLVPPVAKPSVEVGVMLDSNEKPYLGKFILDTYGAYVGNETCVEQGGMQSYKAHLFFNDDIVPGEIAFCSLVRGVVCEEEQNNLSWRIFKKELDYYSCTILFEGQAPRTAEYVVLPYRHSENSEPVVMPLEVKDNFVKVSIRNFGQAGESGYIRYTL